MEADPVSWGVIAASVAGVAVGERAATMLNKPKTPKVKDSTVLQDDKAAKKAADEAANNAAAQKKQQRLTEIKCDQSYFGLLVGVLFNISNSYA